MAETRLSVRVDSVTKKQAEDETGTQIRTSRYWTIAAIERLTVV
jgi:hypothetical protein